MRDSMNSNSADQGIPALEHGKLCAEKDRLGSRCQSIRHLLTHGELREASKALARFQASMAQHMRIEEEILFPKFSDAEPNTAQPLVQELRRDHEELRALLEGLASTLEKGLSALEQLDQFAGLLNDHEAKEEMYVYPTIFHLVEPSELARMASRLLWPRAAGEHEAC